VDAIVTAGGIPKENDALYEFTGGNPKALLEISGKPMVQWVLDALSDSASITNVVVVGLSAENGVSCTKPVSFVPNQGSMLNNIFAGANKILSQNSAAEVVFSVSSDIPTITGQIVDWMAEQVAGSQHDVYYNFIRREDMENRFPGSRRTFTKFKDIEVCGGDLTAFRTQLLTTDGGVWQELIAARKNIFKQAAIIGYGTLFKMLTRQLTIHEAVNRVSKRLELNAFAIQCPYPEIGMDVDKPYQLELLQKDLAEKAMA
jgi:GTP:adenosylcobinamide-phosphate guanylyltransferase